VLTPIILYGLFNVYRNQVNPRASFSDFLFLVAGVAVIANLVGVQANRACCLPAGLHAAGWGVQWRVPAQAAEQPRHSCAAACLLV
jgi:hypothetical protein